MWKGDDSGGGGVHDGDGDDADDDDGDYFEDADGDGEDDDGGEKMLNHFVVATRRAGNKTVFSTEKSAYDRLKMLMQPFVLRRKKKISSAARELAQRRNGQVTQISTSDR